MVSAKSIHVAPIASQDAVKLVQRHHYSGTFVRNSCLHLGVFIAGKAEGVMSFGPPMDKAKVLPVVAGTAWFSMLELNRMAFSDALPRNSESRALAVAKRLIWRNYPHMEWLLTYADATVCGHGTIYQAAGFDLTQIRENRTIYEMPNGQRMAGMSIEAHWHRPVIAQMCADLGVAHVYRSRRMWEALGAKPLPGFQLRYVACRDQAVRDRLKCPILPASAIQSAGARMVRGEAKYGAS